MSEYFDLIKTYLQSPINGGELKVCNNEKNDKIIIDTNNNIYPIINNQPILVNF
jgi:hypothetical protein